MIVPIIEYLEAHHVVFHFNTEVTHVEIEDNEATAFTIKSEGMEETIDLTKQDLLFIHTSQSKDSIEDYSLPKKYTSNRSTFW